MTTTYDYDQAELETVGAKLEAVESDFTDKEKALLSALFARGLQGAREDAGEDVAGFVQGAVLSVRKAGDRPLEFLTGPGGPGLSVEVGDPTGLPTDQISLNFTKGF